jgi:hypothetical protein
MGAGRLVTLLSWIPALSGPTVIGGSLGWRSKHRTEAGPAVLGAWSHSLDGDLDLVIGVEWVSLVCAQGTDEACVFRGTQLGTLIRESLFLCDGMAWLLSSTIIITGTWKNGKIILIAYHLLESSIGAYIEWLVKELIMTANKS